MLTMASSSDSSDAERTALRKQPQRKSPIIYLIPLIYAPVLPLIRITMRHNPVVRDRLFYGVLAGAFAHGVYVIGDKYDIESK
ncbi:uncharacterized protein LOC109828556 [Asparagus officinalis]|uniref:uncharacterized protein LOC109828556 n=1 Tax=Asparagus officinalis TaxID=4686 RepID=UPI00098E4675|nr:uncharacterized protein LOC109828556 [Asparagus officinalis]